LAFNTLHRLNDETLVFRRDMRTDYLKIIFFKKLSKYTQNQQLINGTFDDLVANYTSEKRHYHDLSHIVNMLNLMEDYKFRINDEDAVFFAIWFHDGIYDTWKSTNEEKSALWAKEILSQTAMPTARIERIQQYIMATKTHETNGDSDLNFFLDFDLSILGADEAIYQHYTRQICEEYHLVPNFMYNRGRRRVLKSFLERPYIFQTEDFRARLERQARQNIQQELESL
jgi:predicted metal-dependent HD superfamily phosphohydrolase